MVPLIVCDSLVKSYESEGVKTDVLRGISLSIGKGEFVSIMGPSGSGKSTLMHILGLLEVPTGGLYTFYDKNVKELTENEVAYLRNQNIGFVFQSFNLLPRTSVFENVELPLLYDIYDEEEKSCDREIKTMNRIKRFFTGSTKQCHAEKVKKALLSVGMDHRMTYRSNQLSGGEKQRVAIARALVNNPEIIFADEPTGNLDSKSGLQVMQILQQLNDAGHTIVLVTHETYTAEHAKRIIRILDGKIESDETLLEWRDARYESKLK
ncbi:MAG: ABC transporter ATP-binding protein [Candidatus Moraniibacteriota bacterium]|nr:MAG: ABC transporter ATP-binding protein [Candidatus Moranbacteria bacterium]